MKKITQYVAVAALFIVPIFPLIVANTYFFPFITGKAIFFRIVVEVAFAAWLVLAFLDSKYRPKLTSLTVCVTGFAIIALIADLLGVNPIRSLWSNFERMEGWITIIHLWAFYIASTSIFGSGMHGKKLWHRWLNFSLAIATIVALYGVGQLLGMFDIHQSAARVDATIGNSAYLGIYIVINMFIAAYMFFAVRSGEFTGKRFLQWGYPALFVLFGVIALETQTRGAVIGLAVGLLLALLLYAIFAKRESSRSRQISGGVFVVLAVLAILFYANRTKPFLANSPIFGRLASLSVNEFKGEGRAFIWPMAIKGALERPILGWGQENFNYIFNANYAPQMYGQEQWFDRAHSVFLDWFVASGFVGLIGYVALYVLFIVMVWKSDMSVAKKSVLTGLIAGYAVNNLAVFDNLTSYVFFFAMLAFANSFKEGLKIKWIGEKHMRVDAVEYIVVPIVIILLAGVVYMFNVRPIEANTRLITALRACGSGQPDAALFQSALDVNAYVANQEIREQLYSCASQILPSQQIPSIAKQQVYDLASQQVEAQIAATPKDARAYVLGASLFSSAGMPAKALPLFEKGHELSPAKQSISIALANEYLGSGKTDQAVALLKQAYELAPDNFSAEFSYALGLVVAGKEAQARQMFNNDPAIFESSQMAAVALSVKNYPEAIAIYKKLVLANPKDPNLQAQLGQAQYMSGRIADAIQTLRGIEKDHPEYTGQVDALIKQIQTVNGNGQ